MGNPVIKGIIFTGCPLSTVIGRIYRCTVRFQLPYRTGKVHAVQVHGVSRHIQTVYVQV